MLLSCVLLKAIISALVTVSRSQYTIPGLLVVVEIQLFYLLHEIIFECFFYYEQIKLIW